MDNCNKSVLCHRPHYYYSPYAAPPHHGYDDRHHHHLDHSPSHDRPHGSSSHGHYPYYYGQSVPPAPDYPGSRSTKMDKSLCLPSLQSTPMPTLSSTLSSPAAATGEGTAKPPPRTWKKPLGKPKRPLSAYNYFFQHHRSVVIDALKKKAILEAAEEAAAESSGKKKKKKRRQRRSRGIGVGFAELAREVAFEWKKLEAEGKKEYEEQARLDKERYDKELDAWTLKVEKEELEREETERRQGEEQQQLALEEAQDEEEKARAEEEKAKVVTAVRVESFGSSVSMHNKSLLMADRIESFGSAYSMTSIRRSVIMAERVTSFGTNGGYNCVPHHHLTRSVVLADRIESFSGRNIVIPQDRRRPYHAHGEVEDEEDEEEAEAYAYENHNPYDDKHACEDHKGGDGSDADADAYYYHASSISNESDAVKSINRRGSFLIPATPERYNPYYKEGQPQGRVNCNDELIVSPRPANCLRRCNLASNHQEYEKEEERVVSLPTPTTPSRRHDHSTRREEVGIYQTRTHGESGEGDAKKDLYEYVYVHPSTVRLTPEISAWAEGFFDVHAVAAVNACQQYSRPTLHNDDDDHVNNIQNYGDQRNEESDHVVLSSAEATPRSLSSRASYGCHNHQIRYDEEVRKKNTSPHSSFATPHSLCHPYVALRSRYYSDSRYPYYQHSCHQREVCDEDNKENMAPFVTPPPGPVDSPFSSPTSVPSSHSDYQHLYHCNRPIDPSPYGEQRHDCHLYCAHDEYDDREIEDNKGESSYVPPFPYLSPWSVSNHASNADHENEGCDDATDDNRGRKNRPESSMSHNSRASPSPSSVFRQR